jgi:type II secretory pathway component GspD/PulD (secretin)
VRTTAEVFDPASGAVRSTGPLVEPRSAHTATLLPDGRVVLIGGYLRTGDVSRTYRTFVEIFTPD